MLLDKLESLIGISRRELSLLDCLDATDQLFIFQQRQRRLQIAAQTRPVAGSLAAALLLAPWLAFGRGLPKLLLEPSAAVPISLE